MKSTKFAWLLALALAAVIIPAQRSYALDGSAPPPPHVTVALDGSAPPPPHVTLA
jgi:hypothetical protein